MLTTLIELQRLKRLDRTGWTLRGLANGTESVAAHSFGVAVTAMMLADEVVTQGIPVDIEKLLRMALLHDWSESRVGDMPRTATAYFGDQVRKEAEGAAFADVVSGTVAGGPLYRELFEEYENRKTLEARLVKAADVIDLLVETLALERAGARGLDEFWEILKTGDFQLEGIPDQILKNVFKSLLNARSALN